MQQASVDYQNKDEVRYCFIDQTTRLKMAGEISSSISAPHRVTIFVNQL